MERNPRDVLSQWMNCVFGSLELQRSRSGFQKFLSSHYTSFSWNRMVNIAVVHYPSLFLPPVYPFLIILQFFQTLAVSVRPSVHLHLCCGWPLPVAVTHGGLEGLLLAVEVGELVENDCNGQCHHQRATQDAARGGQLAGNGDRDHITIAHGGHADRPPPPAGRDGVHTHVFLIFGGICHACEDRHAHAQVEQQDSHFPVAVLRNPQQTWSEKPPIRQIPISPHTLQTVYLSSTHLQHLHYDCTALHATFAHITYCNSTYCVTALAHL